MSPGLHRHGLKVKVGQGRSRSVKAKKSLVKSTAKESICSRARTASILCTPSRGPVVDSIRPRQPRIGPHPIASMGYGHTPSCIQKLSAALLSPDALPPCSSSPLSALLHREGLPAAVIPSFGRRARQPAPNTLCLSGVLLGICLVSALISACLPPSLCRLGSDAISYRRCHAKVPNRARPPHLTYLTDLTHLTHTHLTHTHTSSSSSPSTA
ncbi:hypothetical protein AOQ84DRAFT_164022 [Glonium stellatum]|uniref:Uncharacterized protein n=1 Tax=Glonium stellatum TaxID=574774 RepID=A0A8E2EQA8_9PEZI|nr:hypothetical protein AOQ84DRAFT_164022 [Glonium stellatum]